MKNFKSLTLKLIKEYLDEDNEQMAELFLDSYVSTKVQEALIKVLERKFK